MIAPSQCTHDHAHPPLDPLPAATDKQSQAWKALETASAVVTAAAQQMEKATAAAGLSLRLVPSSFYLTNSCHRSLLIISRSVLWM